MFESEPALLEALAVHDDLVRQCVSGQLSFIEFCAKYQDFYAFYALDGRESDQEERQLLEKYESRIKPHRLIAEDILGHACSDEDAELEIYRRAGRFGSAEAVKRLRRINL